MKQIILAFALAALCTASHAAEKSCSDAIGKKDAKMLAEWCANISPATHPPCNVKNSCEMIADEIKRGCKFAAETPSSIDAPFFCLLTQ